MMDDRNTAGNRRLAQWRVKWLIEHSTSHQLLCYVDSFELRNPLLRKAAKRYGAFPTSGTSKIDERKISISTEPINFYC